MALVIHSRAGILCSRAFVSIIMRQLSLPLRIEAPKLMTFWLNLFTGTTWREFQEHGSSISGFREHERNWSRASKIKPGDIFLCYLVGVSRWVGLLEIESERFKDNSRIFTEEVFPVRFRV